jgi:hypothetical protein
MNGMKAFLMILMGLVVMNQVRFVWLGIQDFLIQKGRMDDSSDPFHQYWQFGSAHHEAGCAPQCGGYWIFV